MESNQSNAAALRAFRVLDCVARQPNGCTGAELVETLALPKQTVHRIVTQLQMAGLLIREPGSRRVQLGAPVSAFAVRALMHGSASRERHAILAGLVADIGETCNLTALAGSDIVYLDRVETQWPLRVLLAPGSHVPLHATASGKLLMAMLPAAQRLAAVLPLQPLVQRVRPHDLRNSDTVVRRERVHAQDVVARERVQEQDRRLRQLARLVRGARGAAGRGAAAARAAATGGRHGHLRQGPEVRVGALQEGREVGCIEDNRQRPV
jgi:DNA-binding IclR family transcriptional regulator